MTELLEIKFVGWTATPRMPFVLSGNALCLPVPTYSLLLGVIGCCLGRNVESKEVKVGFKYDFESSNNDLETRQRLEFDGKKIKNHSKGSDAYNREFHANPTLTVWVDRTDWIEYFINPIGTPSLGRSQDILKIEYSKIVKVQTVKSTSIAGTMIPFNTSLKVGGQLVRLAEAFEENDIVGKGRLPTNIKMFMTIAPQNNSKVEMGNLFETESGTSNVGFYLHTFGS